jgi:hypothetical protein
VTWRAPILLALLVILGAVAGCARAMTPEEAAANERVAQTSSAASVARTDAQLAKDKQVAQVAANLGPIGDVVAAKGQPAMGAVITEQRDALVTAVDLKAKDMPPPAVSYEQLMRDAESALADYRVKNRDLQARADAAAATAAAAEKARVEAEAVAKAEKEKADAEARAAWWTKFSAGAVATVGALAAIAARLGLPGGGLVSMGVNLVAPMLRKRGEVAESAVAAADVGRQGLAVVEALLAQKHPEVATQLSQVVSAATGGRADGLEALFKTCAKSYTLDHNGHHASDVDQLLTKLRGERIQTAGGVATALQGIIRPA